MPRPSNITQPRPSAALGPRTTLRRFPLPPLPDESPIKAQLERILTSHGFHGARRSKLFLRYILHHAVAHPDQPLKEYSIALDVFDRDASYDPAVNNTVRVEAGRLRSRLVEYYATEGRADLLLFEVPKGSYRVLVHHRNSEHLPITAPSSSQPGVRLWAIPLAFLLGAFIGYRASH